MEITHPATYSQAILSAAASFLNPSHGLIFDPMAGIGGIHALPVDWDPTIVGMEIELEWAKQHPDTHVGSLLSPTEEILAKTLHGVQPDAIVTSPTYGNRMADHHEARDSSERNTYRHRLGRPLSPGNSGQLQWGITYRLWHAIAWEACYELLPPGGRLVVDIKDHIRGGERQGVAGWHAGCLTRTGFRLADLTTVSTGGVRHLKSRAADPGPVLVMAFDR